MAIIETNTIKSDNAIVLEMLERMIANKQASLNEPPVVKRRKLEDRGPTARVLFLSMQRALNRGPTPDEHARWMKSQRTELDQLIRRRDELAHVVASEARAKGNNAKAVKALNGVH